MNKKNYLLSALTLAVMAGCASQPSSDTASTAALEDFPEYQRLKDSRDELEQENAQLKAEVQKSKTAVTGKVATAQTVESTTTSTTPTADSVMPPNATPGHCYARLVIPEEYETQMKQVMVSPELSKLEVEPAKYAMAEEQVLVSEEWEELVVIPATYKTVTEQVMVKEASTKLVKLPAEYKTVEEKIVIRPAYSTWKKGNGPIEKIDEATGEIMCLVEVPEESKIVTKTILVKPERTEEVVIPAEYKTVEKQVVDVPAHTTSIIHPAVYETVEIEKMVEAPKEIAETIPAVYEEIPQTVKVKDAQLEWREILCETNTTEDVVAELQRALEEKDYNPGPIDGVYGWQTMNAVTRFQKDNDLPSGQLTIQTLRLLGVASWE
jgi:hypothetical protein